MKYDKNSQITKRLVEDIAKFVKAFYFGAKVKVHKAEKLSDIRKTGKIRVFDEGGEEVDAKSIPDETIDSSNQYQASDLCGLVQMKYMRG